MLITLYKIGELHFRLLGTNGFHVKAKSERFSATSSRCRQNLKYENSTSSFGRLRQNIATKSVPHVQTIIFLHSTNQIIDLWRCRWRCRRQILNSLLKLPIRELKKPRGWRQQELHKFAYLTIKNNSLAHFARAFFIILRFTKVLVLSTTWNKAVWCWVDDVSILIRQMSNFIFLSLI